MDKIVNFWIAKKLKERGFREKCLYRYSPYSQTLQPNRVETLFARKVDHSEFYKCYNVYVDNDIDAPTISQVLEWLRGKDFMAEITFALGDDGTWKYSYRVHTKKFITKIYADFSSYEEAASDCIKHCLYTLMREDIEEKLRPNTRN